jgi:hypothetical protein
MNDARRMPARVGARVRAARIVLSTTVLVIGGLFVFAAPAHAQAVPGGLSILKLATGGNTTASFDVSGPGIDGTATLTADAVDGVPTLAGPPLPTLIVGETYTITEVQPDENSPFEFTQALCNNGTSFDTRTIQVTLTLRAPVVTCTFFNTATRAGISGTKVVTGDTSSWTRPAIFHLTCPNLEIDTDLGPVGPGAPGTYEIPFGFSVLDPATCTVTETDTGSNGPVTVTMEVTNHGAVVATGTKSLTFTSHVGDNLVLTVTDAFPPRDSGEPGDNGGTTTTTVAGSTTTAASTTTTVATTTTVPNGAATTTAGGGSPTAAPTTAPSLPTTGAPTGGLLVAALVGMIAGLTLVARTRRFVD